MSIFVIAEIGINHNGSLDIAKQLIDMSKDAGCDAVKFQKRTIDIVYTPAVLDTPRESPWGTTTREQKMGLEFGLDEYKEIVLTAVQQDSYALEYASKELKEDKLFLIECYKINKKTTYINKFIRKFDNLENGQFNNDFIDENCGSTNICFNTNGGISHIRQVWNF